MAIQFRLYSFIAFISVCSSLSWGIGLGAIQPASYLGQPFKAQIPLYDIGDFSSEQLKVGFASNEEHERLGVEAGYQLRNIRVNLVFKGDKSYIELTSREPILEPYLDFVLALRWVDGSLVKNFTVFLDPIEEAAPNEFQQVNRKIKALNTSTKLEQYDVKHPIQTVGKKATNKSNAIRSDGNYRTQSGDSLWLIAHAVKSSHVSQQMMMDSIYRSNLHAFVGGDKRKLKAGVDIKIPDSHELLAIANSDSREAVSIPSTEDTKPTISSEQGDKENTVTKHVDGIATGLPEEERVRYTQEISELSTRVETLTAELTQTHQKMSEMQIQMEGLIEKYQEINLREQNVRRDIAQQSSVDGAINQLEASSLHVVDTSKTPLWVHSSYLFTIFVLGCWIIWGQWQSLTRRKLARSAPYSRAVSEEKQGFSQESAIKGFDDVQKRNSLEENTSFECGVNTSASGFMPSYEETPNVIITASAYSAFGQYGEAERLLSEAILNEPENSELYLALRQIFIDSGNTEKMKEIEDKLATLFPHDLNVQSELS